MARYVDGFVLSIPKDKLATYKKLATKAGRIWKEHGALEYVECVADDIEAKDMVAFPKLAKTKPDEIVIFAYAVFNSRKHRDATNEKIMSDPRLHKEADACADIFDFHRMAYGGFKTLVAL